MGDLGVDFYMSECVRILVFMLRTCAYVHVVYVPLCSCLRTCAFVHVARPRGLGISGIRVLSGGEGGGGRGGRAGQAARISGIRERTGFGGM